MFNTVIALCIFENDNNNGSASKLVFDLIWWDFLAPWYISIRVWDAPNSSSLTANTQIQSILFDRQHMRGCWWHKPIPQWSAACPISYPPPTCITAEQQVLPGALTPPQ